MSRFKIKKNNHPFPSEMDYIWTALKMHFFNLLKTNSVGGVLISQKKKKKSYQITKYRLFSSYLKLIKVHQAVYMSIHSLNATTKKNTKVKTHWHLFHLYRIEMHNTIKTKILWLALHFKVLIFMFNYKIHNLILFKYISLHTII